MFERSGIPGAHSHQLRHTFAASLLQRGVGLESVAALLGHKSIRVTEKHYAAWIASRQTRLEKEVRTTWV